MREGADGCLENVVCLDRFEGVGKNRIPMRQILRDKDRKSK